jgi:hypothetical protein
MAPSETTIAALALLSALASPLARTGTVHRLAPRQRARTVDKALFIIFPPDLYFCDLPCVDKYFTI